MGENILRVPPDPSDADAEREPTPTIGLAKDSITCANGEAELAFRTECCQQHLPLLSPKAGPLGDAIFSGPKEVLSSTIIGQHFFDQHRLQIVYSFWRSGTRRGYITQAERDALDSVYIQAVLMLRLVLILH